LDSTDFSASGEYGEVHLWNVNDGTLIHVLGRFSHEEEDYYQCDCHDENQMRTSIAFSPNPKPCTRNPQNGGMQNNSKQQAARMMIGRKKRWADTIPIQSKVSASTQEGA
jgi:hypothetical protein